MNTADGFDRYVESLLGELASQSLPGYLDDALATATALPQRRRSILWGLRGRSPQPMFRAAMIGLPVMLMLTIGIVGLLMIGSREPTPSPSPLPTLSGTDIPTTAPPTSAPPTSAPTDAVVGPCPGYTDAAAARTLEGGGDAWQGETGPPPPFTSLREGLIAAEARELPGGRPAVVLIDPATGDTCRLIDLEGDEEVFHFAWTSRGDVLAISTGRRVLVWSSAGLTELYRVPRGDTTDVQVAWSPTGEAIAIGGPGTSGLRLVGSDWSQTEPGIDSILELAWSPNGSRLFVAFGAHTGGVIAEALITAEGQVDPLVLEAGAAGWLDDDTLIVGGTGAGGSYDAYDVDSETRQSWSASIEPFRSQIDIGYAPGLTALALFAGIDTEDPVDLVVRELPSGVDHLLEQGIRAGDGVIGTGAWSPNGTRLAVSIRPGTGAPMTGVWLYALDGGESTQVSILDVSLTNGAWQPVP